ncbi:MAG TPA: hypothetical protein VFW69_05055 [Mycobacterium sp.]|nr:hypothetical protein [Mycobacterium sp.]
MAAAANTPIITLFISSSFPDLPNGRVVVATSRYSKCAALIHDRKAVKSHVQQEEIPKPPDGKLRPYLD